MSHPTAKCIALPFAPSAGLWQPLGLNQVTIDGGFWGDRQTLNGEVTIPHVDSWLERLRWTSNFDRAAAGTVTTERAGREFSDSEIYKLLEGMAWELGRQAAARKASGAEQPDPTLQARFDDLVARVAAAQEPDGYLNTQFGRPGQDAKYSNLEWGHELYCYGHLIQAGVARARTVGMDDELVKVAIKAADHVCREFGPDARVAVGGHPEIETALAELSRVTGDQRYLNQAKLFIDRRGQGLLANIFLGQQYFQDDIPVRQAEVFDGHAVRALYLAAGAVDVAVETGDEQLLAAVSQQTQRTLARRTYLTGGMGAHHEGESFGADFELPPDRSYSETCAGIASVMLNQRLLLATGDPRHADAVERTLYNIVATALAADGQGFFYANTLHQRVQQPLPESEAPSSRQATAARPPFFEVSCCPTNITRMLASLGAYLATANEQGVQIHQYAPATIRLPDLVLRMETDYPVTGLVRITADAAPSHDWKLTLRVPAWAAGATIRMSDGSVQTAAPGYVTVPGPSAGQSVELHLPMTARWTYADPRIDAVRGQVAVERGPIVFALESVDLGADVSEARVLTSRPPIELDGRVLVEIKLVSAKDADWPYSELHYEGRPSGRQQGERPNRDGSAAAEPPAPAASAIPPADHPDGYRMVPLIPYYAWAERGPSTMRVWIPREQGGFETGLRPPQPPSTQSHRLT